MTAKNASRFVSAALSAVALLGATAGVAHADETFTYDFNFDSVAAGTLVSTLLPAGISVNPAVYDFARDSNGVMIPGSREQWRIDPNGGDFPVPVVAGTDNDGNPSAPSPFNLMGDRLSPILLSLGPNLAYFNSVSFALDNDTFGDTGVPALFLDVTGATVASVATDQTVAGASYTLTAPNKTAQYLLLPAGASYDNLVLVASTAPEPGTLALATLGLGILLMRRRRA